MAKESSDGMMEAIIKEIFLKTNFLDKEYMSGRMDVNTTVYGEMESLINKESTPGLMAGPTRVNIMMANDMVMVL